MKTNHESATAPVSKTDIGRYRELDEVVSEHPFLKGLSPHQTRILKDCAMLTQFKAGELVFREGDPANRFYLILRGAIVLEAHLPDQGVIPIETIADGDVLGWSWLFPPYYWHFDARAVEDTETMFFYGTPLRDECEADHDLGYEMVNRVAGVMMKRLQAARRRLLEARPRQER